MVYIVFIYSFNEEFLIAQWKIEPLIIVISNDKKTNKMAQFENDQEVIEQEPEIKVGDGKADILIRQVNSHQLMQIMRIIDIHDLEYTFYEDPSETWTLDNDFAIRDMIFDLINKNDSLPTFMQKVVTDISNEYSEWDDDEIQATCEKAEEMEYFFVK